MPEKNNPFSIKDRITLALDRAGKSQRDLAKAMNKSSAAVSEMLSKPAELDSISYVEAASKLTGYNFEWLRTGRGPEKISDMLESPANQVNEDAAIYLSAKMTRKVVVPVDAKGSKLIPYIPVKDQAAYRQNYRDHLFIQNLPSFSLPLFSSADKINRMFQVDGNAMRQNHGGLNDGDIVIGEYVEDIFSIKDGCVYVVHTKDSLLIKRCVNRLAIDKVLVLESDNRHGGYPAIIIQPDKILEVWEYKAHISSHLPLNDDLKNELNDIKTKQALLEDEIKRLKIKQTK